MNKFSQIFSEYAFSEQDFLRVKKHIYDRAGISLGDNKKDLVYSRLLKRLRHYNFNTFKEYLDYLDKSSYSNEWQEFVNAMTTNLTSFFRENHHFPILVDHIRTNCVNRRIIIWCSASSTGEEAYSIAMSLVEAFNYNFKLPLTVLATDIDTDVLKFAEEGIYNQDKIGNLSTERLNRFFMKGSGAKTGLYKVRQELKDLVRFRQLNLLDTMWNLRGPLDAIFCRNVMIYFDRPTQHDILKRFVPLLAHNGLLFIGHSESLYDCSDLFSPLGRTTYKLANPSEAKSMNRFQTYRSIR